MKYLERLYVGGLAVIFGLIVVHAPLSVFFGTHFGHALVIKSWKELMMGILFILALVIIGRRHAWRRLMTDPIIILSLLLAVLYIISAGYGHGAAAYGAGFLIDLRYILFGVLVYVAVTLVPWSRPVLIRVGLVGAVVVVVFGLLQTILPRDFLKVLGYSKDTITPYTTIDSYEGLPRLQSTLRGPNPLGAYTLIVACVTGAAALLGKFNRRVRMGLGLLTVLSLVVLFGSYSRSAYIGLIFAALVGVVILLQQKRIAPKKLIIASAVCVIVVSAGAFALKTTTFYDSVIQHEVAGSGPAVDSNDGHSASLTQGWAKLITHPFGYGTGSTGSASLLGSDGYIVENQYLYVAHEAGWLALIVFLALVGILLKRAYQRRRDPVALAVFTSGLGLLIVGLLLPVFADDTVSIVWFGLAALVAASPKGPYEK